MQIITRIALLCILGLSYAQAAMRTVNGDNSHHPGMLRGLKAEAISSASGSQSASAFASSSSVNGQENSYTSSSASGSNATTAGLSVAGGQVDVCVNGPNKDYSVCRTLAPSQRASQCTDVPPDDRYTCEEQAGWGKCNATFIFPQSYCLKSCNRCGSYCQDVSPPSGSCDKQKCDSSEYTNAPYCLKTCSRCAA